MVVTRALPARVANQEEMRRRRAPKRGDTTREDGDNHNLAAARAPRPGRHDRDGDNFRREPVQEAFEPELITMQMQRVPAANLHKIQPVVINAFYGHRHY